MFKTTGHRAFAILLIVPLASCGGSGGGGVSSPGTTAPPTLVNTTITGLVASQTFANDAATTTATLDTAAGVTTTAAAARSTLTISYDAGSRSYTVSETGRSQTFGPSDTTSTVAAGEAMYKKSANGTSDYLTLVTTPFETTTANRYVGLGFWQRNQLTGTRQDTTFDLFTYGLDTPAAGVPRTGTGSYGMDAFAFLNLPGTAPQTLQGTGTFDVDFKSGVFSQTAMMSTFDVITNKPLATGYLPLTTAGTLSSGDGTFSGTMSFSGATGLNRPIAGTSAGRFYGPAGEELGATFAGSNVDGATLNGGYTGQLGSGGESQNLALTNVTVKQQFSIDGSALLFVPNPRNARGSATHASITLDGAGGFTYDPNDSLLDQASFGAANVVAGPANFTTYATTSANGHAITASLYTPGGGNTELALTYASFGSWQETGDAFVPTNIDQHFFAYGIVTQPAAIASRTGTAQYSGVAYGAAFDANTTTRYAVTGTSSFAVDFSAQSFTGGLALKGAPNGGGGSRDLGSYAFAGQVGGAAMAAALTQGGTSVGQMGAQFYGPTGQEVAGTFFANSGGVSMAGAIAAKQR